MERHIQLLERAATLVIRAGKATPLMLRMALGLSSENARRMIDELWWIGIVGPDRKVLVSPSEWRSIRAG